MIESHLLTGVQSTWSNTVMQTTHLLQMVHGGSFCLRKHMPNLTLTTQIWTSGFQDQQWELWPTILPQNTLLYHWLMMNYGTSFLMHKKITTQWLAGQAIIQLTMLPQDMLKLFLVFLNWRILMAQSMPDLWRWGTLGVIITTMDHGPTKVTYGLQNSRNKPTTVKPLTVSSTPHLMTGELNTQTWLSIMTKIGTSVQFKESMLITLLPQRFRSGLLSITQSNKMWWLSAINTILDCSHGAIPAMSLSIIHNLTMSISILEIQKTQVLMQLIQTSLPALVIQCS